MRSDDEAMLDPLAGLPMLMPDQERAERTRRRCRERLASQRRREQNRPQSDLTPRSPVVVSVFCLFYVVYVSALVATALNLRDLLN